MAPDPLNCPACGAEASSGDAAGMCPRCLLGVVVETLDHDAGELPTGTRLGEYVLLDRVARGGMGVVYRARHETLGRTVALKVLAASGHAAEEARRRFAREATLTARLDHPGIVPLHELGLHEGRSFLVMPFVDGRTLSELLGGRPLATLRAIELVRRLAEAVHYAHERGVLHRDLKPANVLVEASGQPRITDFGLARELAGDASFTLSGVAMGTPPYAAPELLAGRPDQIDRRTDVYALGAILYECLTGVPPFFGAGTDDTIRRVLTEDPIAPSMRSPGVPSDAESICLKCLEKDRDRRYGTASELAEDLARAIEGRPTSARPVTPTVRVRRWVGRNKALSVAIASTTALVVALVAIAALLWPGRGGNLNDPQLAERTRSVLYDLRVLYGHSPVDHAAVQERLRESFGPLHSDLTLKPETTESWYHLGACHALLGNRARAIEYLSEAARLEPGFTSARDLRARLWIREYLETRRPEFWSLVKAEWDVVTPETREYAEAARRVRSGQPVEFRPIDALDAGQWELAARAGDGRCWSRVIELEPRNALAFFERAKLRWDINRVDSEADLKRARELDPALARDIDAWLDGQP